MTDRVDLKALTNSYNDLKQKGAKMPDGVQKKFEGAILNGQQTNKPGAFEENSGFGIKGLSIERTGQTESTGNVYQHGAAVENPDDPVTQFKKLDKDGDLKVSAQEYTDSIVEEYVSNGHQLPSGYDNIAEFINAKYEEFKKFAGKDVSMNIDEFRAMLEARLSESAKDIAKAAAAEAAAGAMNGVLDPSEPNPPAPPETPTADTTAYEGDHNYSGDVDWSGNVPNDSTHNAEYYQNGTLTGTEQEHISGTEQYSSTTHISGNDGHWEYIKKTDN